MKILIACPTYDGKKYALKEWVKALKKLEFAKHKVDFLVVDTSKNEDYKKELENCGLRVERINLEENPKDNVLNARNLIREICIKEDYDYLFSLEQDVIIEPNTLLRLLSHNKSFVSGVVYNNLPYGDKIKSLPMIYVEHPKDPTGLWYIGEKELEANHILQVKGVSLSCVLIHKLILEKVKFRRYEKTWDDLPFCEDTIKNGFNIYVDPTIKPKHLHE